MADISKIKLFRDCMESDVKPHLDDEVFEGLMDLLHLAIIEAYNRGSLAAIRKLEDIIRKEQEDRKIELKRCPFCGGYAHLDDPSETGDYGVSCENCGAFVMFGKEEGECQTKEEATEAWNRRADDD